jgi:integrase
MLEHPATTYTARRLHTLLALILDTGLRIQEALDLRLDDLSISRGCC